MMFWIKLKTCAAIVLAGALLSGTGLMGYRAMGRAQAPTAAAGQQPEGRAGPDGKPAARRPGTASTELEAIGKARVAVAKKLRDAAMTLWQRGEIEHHRVPDRAETLRRSRGGGHGQDRRRSHPVPRATGGRAQAARRGRPKAATTSGMIRQSDVFTAELARLDAEYALAKAKATMKARTGSK